MTVQVLIVEPRPTAVIAEATTWQSFTERWAPLLDEVWAAVRGNDDVAPGRNVMLYKDDVPHVEVGVEARGPFSPIGRVTPSRLPGGRVATATHRAPFEQVGETHDEIVRWCDANGYERLGPRWEVYGHWDEQAPQPLVDVFYLVR